MKKDKIAIFELCGKQYLAGVGDVITVENFADEVEDGKQYTIDRVLLVYDEKEKKTAIGTPYIDKAKIICTKIEDGKGKKVSVIKYKSKSRYFRNTGHRQEYTKLRVDAI